MNAVLFYSNTGECRKIAEYASDALSFPLCDIVCEERVEFDDALLVFPVHCQNIPKRVKSFLERTRIKKLSAVAVYGGICHGNVLYELQKKYCQNITAAAYIPAKHAYTEEASFSDYSVIDPLLKNVGGENTVLIRRSYKSPLASFFPELRSRIGIKMICGKNCDGCGTCESICPENAMKNGKPCNKCIRCLKCVTKCPKNALSYKIRLPMKLYLKQRKEKESEYFL